MAPKVVIENAVLRGSRDGSVQIVARVYSDGGQEFRVIAPEHATGNALDWIPQLHVRTLSKEIFVGEEIITDGRAQSVIQYAKVELEKHELDEDIWKDVNSQGRYCAAQICLRGHAHSIDSTPYKSDERCPKCGEICIDRCPSCQAPIRGGVVYAPTSEYQLPYFCYKCGRAYPWMGDRLRTARELLNHDDKLSLEERDKLWGLLQYVMSDPKADLVPAKKKLIEINLRGALPATREFFLDFMAKLGAEMLKP